MTVTRFRRKPIVVHALQWTGDNEIELREFTGGQFGATRIGDHMDPAVTAEVYDSLHSTWVGMRTGQWVIRGVRRECYPIDEAVLAETYERMGGAE